jgi:glutathione peroxidase-family protein
MATSETYQISHEEMRKYTGQYVAIMNGKVVASGKNLYKKIEELEKKHPDKKIIVTYIPTEDLLIL